MGLHLHCPNEDCDWAGTNKNLQVHKNHTQYGHRARTWNMLPKTITTKNITASNFRKSLFNYYTLMY